MKKEMTVEEKVKSNVKYLESHMDGCDPDTGKDWTKASLRQMAIDMLPKHLRKGVN